MAELLLPLLRDTGLFDARNCPTTSKHPTRNVHLEDLLDAALRPLFALDKRRRDEQGSSLSSDSKQFQVKLDCQHFDPKELTVKVVDGSVVIHGKHEERKDDHGFITREFTRRYPLPEDVESEKITSSLDAHGVLTLTAPRKQVEPLSENERVIPVILAQSITGENAEQ